ncbi:MAG TPA: MBL fold metallo-hydrolase [Candidatus Binatia bacterium]|nr:MBL fold metallo-hydrolase [Candidatus Binatia bacterium]
MLKKFALLLFLALATDAFAEMLPEPRTIKVNNRVFALLGPVDHANRHNQGYMINSTVIIGDTGVVLIESGGTDEVGQHIAAAVRRLTPKPVTHVVNTHHHGDHSLGNVAFAGAKFISSEKCRDMVLKTGEESVRRMERDVRRRFPGTRPIAADITYKEGTKTSVILNGVNFIFWVPQGSHTVGDILVYLPDDRLLVAGDILVNGVVPNMRDANIKNWISTLEELQRIDVNVFVPGHGPLMNKSDVKALHHSISTFYSGVKKGFLKGLRELEVRRFLDLSHWERLERSYVIGRNINRAYREIGNDKF